MDLFPTITEIVGIATGPKTALDGVSLVPLLQQSGKLERDELFWHYPHYQHYQQGGTTPYSAIRKGDFKLIEFLDDKRVELYNLRDDIGEQHNLASRNAGQSERASRTVARLARRSRRPNADAESKIRSVEAGAHSSAEEEQPAGDREELMIVLRDK